MSEEVEEITPDDIEQAQVTAWLSDKGVTDEPEEAAAEDQEPLESAEVEDTAEAAPDQETEDAAPEEPEKETPRVSRAFSKVAQKERRLQKERQEINTMKQGLKNFQDAAAAAQAGDHVGAMKKIGISYENAANQILQNGKRQTSAPGQADPAMEARLAKLEGMEKQKQVNDYVARLKTIVDNDEKFELTRAQWDNAWPTILEMQKIVATETGRVKPEAEILQDVEDFYEQQTKQLAGSTKMRKLLGQTDAGTTQDTPSESQRTRPRTLRNKISASSQAPQKDPATRRERLEQALTEYDRSVKG